MAQSNTPTPSPATFIPTVESFLAEVDRRFADNTFGKTQEIDFREVFAYAATVFADWRHLNVKRVKGATYPVPYTDTLGLVPVDYRILGMQAVALNGVDAATGGAGVTAPPVYFALLRDSNGTVQALLDGEAGTTLTVKARWVQVSGSEADKMAQFDFLELEDHPYAAGDVVKWTFDNGQTSLVEWIADSAGNQHPVPTGLPNDPIYRTFAPLAISDTTYDDAPLQQRLAAAEAQLTDVRTRFAAVMAGADGAVDTFIEAFNRFVAGESAAAAINAQLAALALAIANGPAGATYTAGMGIAISPDNVISAWDVVHKTGNVVELNQHAEYEIITYGTFSVNTGTKRIGAVVCIYLGPGSSQPTLPNTEFQSKDIWVAGKNLMYMFKVGANGLIQYTITVLD